VPHAEIWRFWGVEVGGLVFGRDRQRARSDAKAELLRLFSSFDG